MWLELEFASSDTFAQDGIVFKECDNQGLLQKAYMWDVRVPSVVQLLLLLPRVFGGVDFKHASWRRALVRHLSHVANFLVASELQRKYSRLR